MSQSGLEQMLVTCEYIPSSFATSVEVEVPSRGSVEGTAALKRAVCEACKRKFEQHGIPVAPKRFKVDVPVGVCRDSLPQPIRVTGKSDRVRARGCRYNFCC